MVRISTDHKRFSRLKTPTFVESKMLERGLEELIWNSSEDFCLELEQQLLMIGRQVRPSTVVGDSIDLLAIDADGNTVILELKRGNNKLQLFQAISYAGMVAGLAPEELRHLPGVDPIQVDKIGGWMAENAEGVEVAGVVNQDPRIILVAEAFDYEILAGARWLYEKHDVDIACVKISMALDEGGAEYLAFTQIFPPREIEEVAIKKHKRRTAPGVPGPSSPERKYTVDELLKLADDEGIRPLVDIFRRVGEKFWDETISAHPSFISFVYSITTDSGWRLLCRVYVTAERLETPHGQLDVQVFSKRLAEVTGQDEAVIRDTLAHGYPQQAAYVNYCIIRLSTPEQAEALVTQLKEWWNLRTPALSLPRDVQALSVSASGGGEEQ